jgi:hypothetical protein
LPAVHPPSAGNTTPVINDAAIGVQMNAGQSALTRTKFAIISVVRLRHSGVLSR